MEYVVLENGDKIPPAFLIELWSTGNMAALSNRPITVVSTDGILSNEYAMASVILGLEEWNSGS